VVTTAGWTLIYDGDCAFCTRWARRLRRWDARGRLNLVQSGDSAALAKLPTIERAALEGAMHLVGPDGTINAGAAAIPGILALLPFGRPFASLFALPLVRRIADGAYRWVARNRHRLPGGTSDCETGQQAAPAAVTSWRWR
jgi:predicted DCC family thiol-disulfide oxidoreductase YuxK